MPLQHGDLLVGEERSGQACMLCAEPLLLVPKKGETDVVPVRDVDRSSPEIGGTHAGPPAQAVGKRPPLLVGR